MINQRLLLTILVLLFLATSVQGQDKESQLKAIRKAYAEAKKDMADNGKDGLPRMDIKISVNDGTEVSEDFVINDEGEVCIYFKRIRQQADTDLFDPHCYFIIEKWGANGHSSYREMLFDPFDNHLMFSFMHAETHAGFVIESRYYYDAEGRLIDQKHKTGDGESSSVQNHTWSSSEGDLQKAKDYQKVFDGLMSHKDLSAGSPVAVQTADKATLLKQIRATYAEAKQKVDKDAKSEVPRNITIEIHDQEDMELPASKMVVKFWFDYVVNGTEPTPRCYFISTTCDLGDHHVYSEYLPDPKTSRLIFCFSQQPQNDGSALEWRYYFDDSGRCVEVKGTDSKAGPGFADIPMADFYLALFQTLVSS